jgi:hypothetical protein
MGRQQARAVRVDGRNGGCGRCRDGEGNGRGEGDEPELEAGSTHERLPSVDSTGGMKGPRCVGETWTHRPRHPRHRGRIEKPPSLQQAPEKRTSAALFIRYLSAHRRKDDRSSIATGASMSATSAPGSPELCRRRATATLAPVALRSVLERRIRRTMPSGRDSMSSKGECGEFADAQRAGVADQDEGRVGAPPSVALSMPVTSVRSSASERGGLAGGARRRRCAGARRGPGGRRGFRWGGQAVRTVDVVDSR